MSINRIQKLLLSEFSYFNEMVLVESPFAETSRDGRGLRQVHLALTPTKLIIATDILPLANGSNIKYIPGVDPEIETFQLVSIYPIECVNLSIFHRRKRQSIKARFVNNKCLYFELGGLVSRNMFWNLWCEQIRALSHPTKPTGSSHSETSVGTSTTNSSLYLISSRRKIQGTNSQMWCHYAAGNFERKHTPVKWPDKYLYLGKKLEEPSYQYVPVTVSLAYTDIAEEEDVMSSILESTTATYEIKLPNEQTKEEMSTSWNARNEAYLQLAENAIKVWESNSRHETNTLTMTTEAGVNFSKSNTSAHRRHHHRRRYAFAPHAHFHSGLGPWDVRTGERYSLQGKRAVSLVTIKRQPIESELRLPVSKRQLVATISCEALYAEEKAISKSSNTIRLSPKTPMLYFWTPEYWYRPRENKDTYSELQAHLNIINEYHKRKKTKCYCSSDEEESDYCIRRRVPKRRSRFTQSKCPSRIQMLEGKRKSSRDSSLHFLKQVLRMDVSLTAWDFDSNTLAFQLTLIDKELFLKVTPMELGILMWQQSSKNAPNIGAIIAFSHRISCLVTTEILKDDSEKIRARLVARFINTAEKCDKIANFQSCRSVLCGLQSPPVYRLYSMWTYIRKKHSSRYEVFEKLCRIYRDPRLLIYQKTFARCKQNEPRLPYIGDLVLRLLDKVPSYSNLYDSIGIKVAVKRKNSKPTASIKKPGCHPTTVAKKLEVTSSVVKKILTSLKISEKQTTKSCECTTITTASGRSSVETVSIQTPKILDDYYSSEAVSVDDEARQRRLNECVRLLTIYQKAAANYVYARNELAAEYLLKARYREDKENFFNSFNIEPPII